MAAVEKRVTHLVEKSALRVVDLELIQVDKSYQRDVKSGHKKIITDFEIEALGIPLVAEREDGTLWIVDGLQRITALRTLGKKTVRAEVFRSEGPEHEARIFKKVNKNRTRLTMWELFKARLTEGDEDAWSIKKLTEKLGFTMGDGGKTKDNPSTANRLVCIARLELITREKGLDVLEWCLSTVKEAWPGDVQATNDRIIGGMAQFFVNQGKIIDQERLILRLRTTQPGKLRYQASLASDADPSSMAALIMRLYKKRMKGAK